MRYIKMKDTELSNLSDLLEKLAAPEVKDVDLSWSTKSCKCMNSNTY